MGDLKGKLTRFEKLQGLYDDAETMIEMLDEEYDPAMIPEAEEPHRARNPAIVVTELPATDLNVSAIACAIARSLLSYFFLYA